MKWIHWLPFGLRTSWQIWALGFCHNRTEQATWDISLGAPRVGTCVRASWEQDAFQITWWCRKNLGSARCLIGERQEGKHYAQKPSPLWGLTERAYTQYKHWEDCSSWHWEFFHNTVLKLQCMVSSHFSLEDWEIMNLQSDSAAH